MIKASIHCILLFLLPICATSQKADFQFYTTADGLSNNRIWSCTQDQQGFIWLSTDGLNRFDGQHFLNYTTRPEPIFAKNDNQPSIHSIGSELISFDNNNLLAFNTLSGETKAYPLTSFITDDVFINVGQSIEIAEEYVIIPVFSKQKKEVALIKYQQGKLTKVATLHDANANFDLGIITICANQLGHIFYQDKSLNNIVRIDTTGKKLAEIPLPKKKEVTLKSGYGNTVFGNADNLFFELDERTQSFRPHPINDQLDKIVHIAIYDFVQTPNGDLWVACDDRQLLFYEAETGQLFNFQEQLKTVVPFQLTLNRIALDKTGVLWINTITGLLRVTPQRKWFDTYFAGQWDACEGQCSFRGFAENEEGAVFASFYSNVFKINPKEKTTSPPLYPSNITPFDLHFEEGKLLLNNGWVFNLESQQISNPYSINLESFDGGIFVADGNNGLWLANRRKLFFLRINSTGAVWENVATVTDQGNFTDIKFDHHNGVMWFSTTNTLRAYHAVQGTIKLISEYTWPEYLGIRYLHPDRNGHIWIASDSGLLHFDPEKASLKKYTTEDGLPNNNVVTILPEGDSCLWLGTNLGLSRFSKTTETFINFYEEDGLAHNEFNRRSAFKTKNGQLFFGGIGGVTAFYPEEVMEEYRAERKSARLSLTSFTKTDADLDTTFTTVFNGENPVIDIFHKNKTFQFEYVLTDFRQPEKVSYSYQLAGYDNVWSKPSAVNTATFNALPSGSYTFRVRAFNGRGQWHSEELQVKLVVHPPWWATWWAYLLYALAVAGVASGIFYFLKKRWDLQNSLLLEQAEAQRLKELDGFKSRLFTNLTHEFRTPLTVILGMAERGKVESGKLGNGIAQEQLQTVSNFLVSNFQLIENNGQNLLRLVNQLLDLSKLEDKSFRLNLQQSDIVPYLRYVTESFQTFANSHNIALRFFTTLKDLEMDFDPEQLKQVMTNLISNAIKFTPSGGEVEVSVGRGQFSVFSGQLAVDSQHFGLPTANCQLKTAYCLLKTAYW
jgi:ligand-binding sensor domain-containing protein